MNNKNTDNKMAKGGLARAASLSSEEKHAIAKKAAEARWNTDLPKAEFVGDLPIGDEKIPCAVIEIEGRAVRVLVQREFVGMLTGHKKGNLDRYLNAGNLRSFLPARFKDNSTKDLAIIFDLNGRKAYGWDSEDIIDILKMYIKAKEAGIKLLPSQINLAERAEMLFNSFAHVGLVGLIDEVSGYQMFRPKDALQAYLERVIQKELAAWIRRFPDEFYKEMYRLNNWSWTGTSQKRPGVAGKFTADVVYSRLGPGILDKLREVNPKNEKGNRLHRHHQFLTEEIGQPQLAQHLYAVIGLMRMSNTWKEFKAFLDRAYPVQNDIMRFLKSNTAKPLPPGEDTQAKLFE